MGDLVLKCFKSNGRNGLHNLQSEGLINETDYFTINLHGSTRLPVADWVILITDFPFELEERYVEGKYFYVLSEYSLRRYFRAEGFEFNDYSREVDGLKMSKLFVNYPMGISEIQLYDNRNEIVVTVFKVNVFSDKLNEGEFVSLVNYIESKSVALWAQYSLLKNEASLNDSIDKNDWQLLFLERFIKEIRDKLYFFEYDKLTTYKKESQIVSYASEVLVDEDSIYWLAQNLDVLSNTNSADFEKIVIQNRLFRPSEILTHTTFDCTDILENKFVHGFIDMLIVFLTIQKEDWEDFSFADEGKSFQEILYYYSQKRKHRLFNEYLGGLQNIKSYLSDSIPVTEIVLDYIPTHRIASKDHYQFVYVKFVEWFSYDRVKFSNNKIYFKGVTRMDKLFERACLYKLIDVFATLGYVSEIEKTKDRLPQIVRFKHDETGRFFSMYFEIYPDKYATQNNGRALKPDFFIEFDNNKILILDSKYKKNNTVQKYDWDKLTLKYLHGIGYKNGGYFSPIALFALIPVSNNKTEFYQSVKYDLSSQTPAFPAIGSLIVDFEDKSSDLEKYMKRVLELIY
jgi:hypothetical protein